MIKAMNTDLGNLTGMEVDEGDEKMPPSNAPTRNEPEAQRRKADEAAGHSIVPTISAAFSSDPFDPNFRVVLDHQIPQFIEAMKDMGETPNPKTLEYVQSAEYAERCRPWRQFHEKLKASR
jgi:hypothetical protein